MNQGEGDEISETEEKDRILLPAEQTKGGAVEAASQSQGRPDEAAGFGNIEKARDILFGSLIHQR